MIDLQSYRSAIGCFLSTAQSIVGYITHKKSGERANRSSQEPSSHSGTKWTITYILVITVIITTIWIDTDERHGKNRQRPTTYRRMDYKNADEKKLFNSLRDVSSKLIRSQSHLDYFSKCKKDGVYPTNLEVRDHFQVAFKSPVIKSQLKIIDDSHILEKIDACISHYRSVADKLKEDSTYFSNSLKNISTTERFEYLLRKNEQFSSKLKYQLKKTKEKKINKLHSIRTSQPAKKLANEWIKDLGLTKSHKQIIENNEDLDDFIIFAALSLLNK